MNAHASTFTKDDAGPAQGPARLEDLIVSVHVDRTVLEADWRALEASSAVSLHQSFDWCAAWVATHGSTLLLVRGRIGRRTLFILPLELVRTGIFRTARFIGAPHSNMNTGLFAEDLGGIAPEALALAVYGELARKLAHVADIVTLEKIPLHWRGYRHALASLPSIRNQNASYQLPLLPDFSATLAQINAKRRRKKFRVSEKRMEAYGGYDYVVAQTQAERRAVLAVFLQQKAARFEALGLPNVFRDAETQAFLRQVVAFDGHADSHPLALHALRLKGEQDGRIAAVAGISRKGDHMICQFGSIDETLAAEASPGELLFYRIIEQACADGVRLFDFGIGDQAYKRSWCTVETPQCDIVLPLTTRGRAAAFVHRLIVASKRAIKANRRAYGLIQRIRQKRQGKVPQPADDADDR